MEKEGRTKVSMKRFVLFLCGNRKMCVSLCQSKRGRQTYRTGSTGILINNLHETEDKFHLLMAGHAPQGGSERTVDYKGGEHSKPISSEFHHITSAVLIEDGQGVTHREYNLARPSFWDG